MFTHARVLVSQFRVRTEDRYTDHRNAKEAKTTLTHARDVCKKPAEASKATSSSRASYRVSAVVGATERPAGGHVHGETGLGRAGDERGAGRRCTACWRHGALGRCGGHGHGKGDRRRRRGSNCPRASPCVAGPFGSVDPDEDVALPAERFERPKRDVSGSNRFFASSATRWKRSSRTP